MPEDSPAITSPARLTTVGLILAAAVLLCISTALERLNPTIGQTRRHSGTSAPIVTWNQSGTHAGHADPEFNVDVESLALIVGATMLSVALAVILLTIAARWVTVVTVLVTLAFTVLDILTVIEDVSHAGGTPGDLLAVLVMVLHVLVCFTAAYAVPPSPAMWSKQTEQLAN